MRSGLHANAVHRGWIVNKLELQLEGDLNITAVWGTGDVSEKPVGFTDVRVKVDMVCEGIPQSEIDALVTHVKKWSPVANTFTRPVNLEVSVSLASFAAGRLGAEGFMGSLAVSRLVPDDDLASASIADQVATIARKNLAPLAAAIDAGTVYPDELLRRLGDVGAWGSHQPRNGAADLRCAIQSIAALGEVCGATAFMAWCQNTLVWYVANSDNPALAARFADGVSTGSNSRRHRSFQSDEDLLRNREAEIEGAQGRGRLCRAGRAALGVQSRPGSFLRHDLRDARTRPARS